MQLTDQQNYPPVKAILKNGAAVTIRPLAPGDGEALGDFYEAVPREDFRFYCPHPLTREKARENAEAALSPTQVVLVAETDRQAIGGYAWFRWKEGSAKSGFGICARREFQNSGLGRALMTRLLEIARQVGPPVMALTVQKANARAVALYQRLGFRIVREQMRKAQPGLGFAPEPEYGMELKTRE